MHHQNWDPEDEFLKMVSRVFVKKNMFKNIYLLGSYPSTMRWHFEGHGPTPFAEPGSIQVSIAFEELVTFQLRYDTRS